MTPATSTTSTPHAPQPLISLVQDLAPPAWAAALPAEDFTLTTVRVAEMEGTRVVVSPTKEHNL